VFAIIFIATMYMVIVVSNKETAINALKGKNPYRMEISYKQVNDSTFMVADTVFVKNGE